MATEASRRDAVRVQVAAMQAELRRAWEKHLGERQRLATEEVKLLRRTMYCAGAVTGAALLVGPDAAGLDPREVAV